MVIRFVVGFLVLFLFFVNACSNVVCTTPYILDGRECCLDDDDDGACDAVGEVDEAEGFEAGLGDGIEEGFTEDFVESVGVLDGGENEAESNIVTGNFLEFEKIEEEKNLGYFLGGDDIKAKAEIIFYGDYEDFLSAKFNNEIMPLLLEEYGELLRIEFRNLPKKDHRYSEKGTGAVYCAGEQEMFWEYHESLFDSKGFTESDFGIFARDLELDVFAFESCLKSRKYVDKMLENKNLAINDNVAIVPSFIVNGKRIATLRTFDYFKNLLDEDLKYEIKPAYLKKLIASVQGDGLSIRAGVAVMDGSFLDSPYTDNSDLITGKVYFSGEDKTLKDSIFSEDGAKLNVDFGFFTEEGTVAEMYEIKMDRLRTVGKVGKNYHGGLATDVYQFGGSGGGTNLLPKTFAYIYAWGEGDVFLENELVEEDVEIEFYVVKGIRESGKLRGMEEEDIELYVFLPGRFLGIGKELNVFEDGFVYLFWENGINLKSV